MSSDYQMTRARTTEVRSPHNRVVIFLLCIFFGYFGVHRFAVGKLWTGLFMLLTGGGFGILWIWDFVMMLLGRFTDVEGRVLGPPKVERVALLPPPEPTARALPQKLDDVEPELSPLREDDIDLDALDREVMGDPLEEQFAELEREMKAKK